MSANDTSRLQVLEDLVEHRVPARESQARLAGFAWDEEELVDLEVRHVVAVLTQLVDGEIDAAEATEWADAVDLRDDLGRQPVARPRSTTPSSRCPAPSS